MLRTQYFRNAKMARGGIRRLVERDFLPQRRLDFVVSRDFGLLAFGRQSSQRRFDGAGINLVELLNVDDDVRDLRCESAPLVISNLQMRELGNLLNVGFGYGHHSISKCGIRSWNLLTTRFATRNTICRGPLETFTQLGIRNLRGRVSQFRWQAFTALRLGLALRMIT